MILSESVPNWKGFRYIYDNYVCKSDVEKVVFNDRTYYLPNDKLKLRFELEFYCNRKRMISPNENFVLKINNKEIEVI